MFAPSTSRVAGVAALMAVLSTGCDVVSGLTEFSLGQGGGTSSGGGGTGGDVATGAGGVGGVGGVGGEGGLARAMGDFEDIQPVFATGEDEDDPTFTADRLEVYFNAGEGAGIDIFRSTRSTPTEPWGSPVLASMLNTPGADTNPALSPDGLTIYLARQDDGFDIHMSTRSNRTTTWSIPAPVAGLNSPENDYPGSITSDGTLIVLQSDRDGQPMVYFAERDRDTAPWEPPYVPGFIDQGVTTGDAWISPDGLYVYWRHSQTIRHASRPSRDASFVVEGTLDELENNATVHDPWLNPGQSYIMFARGMTGERDIFEAFRPVDRR